ncbi:N6-adenosine-methyltransferase subunit mettl14, partial [Rhizophlyctis rosea]
MPSFLSSLNPRTSTTMTNNPDKTFLYEVIKARKRKREVERVEAGLDVVSPDLVQRVEPLSKGKRNEKQEKKEGGRKERRTVRNDYSQNCVNTGYRPQNYIRDSSVLERFEEYPKLQTLTTLKNSLVRHRSTPPMYLHCDLRTFPLHTLKTRFDVILIDPPLE